MGKYKAVLFDFDGTIMDTNKIILGSWDHLFNKMTGHPADRSKVVKTFGEILRDTMLYMLPGRDPDECVMTYREYQMKIWDEPIYMFDGVDGMLRALKDAGILLGLVTSRVWSSTKNGFYKFDCADLIDAIVSADDTHVHKPDPYPVQLCLEKLGVSKDEALYVGDSRFDILCGNNAGVDTCAVNWSICFPPEDRTGAQKPDFEIDSPADLLSLVCG